VFGPCFRTSEPGAFGVPQCRAATIAVDASGAGRYDTSATSATSRTAQGNPLRSRKIPAIPACGSGVPGPFYRLLTENPPSLDDFRSYDALGKRPPAHLRDDANFLHRWQGLSVYDTYEEARRWAKARAFKRWAYIAELWIPEDAPIIYEGPDAHGHWNLYAAEPAFLRNECLVRVIHASSIEVL
jgi:hypothetical protein